MSMVFSPIVKGLAVARALMLNDDGSNREDDGNEEWHGVAP